jgi:hypothetical protein
MSFDTLLKILGFVSMVILVFSILFCLWGTFSMVHDIHEHMIPKKKKEKDPDVLPETHLG